jgi:hypothetical protein
MTPKLKVLIALVEAQVMMLVMNDVFVARLVDGWELDIKQDGTTHRTLTSTRPRSEEELVIILDRGTIVAVRFQTGGKQYTLAANEQDELVEGTNGFPVEKFDAWQKNVHLLIEGL